MYARGGSRGSLSNQLWAKPLQRFVLSESNENNDSALFYFLMPGNDVRNV